jgi:hypothetical protein
MGGASAWAAGCSGGVWVFWFLPLLVEALRMFVVGWLF